VFPVRYGLNCYILFRRDSVFEVLNSIRNTYIRMFHSLGPDLVINERRV
jgi:hypothetical protein